MRQQGKIVCKTYETFMFDDTIRALLSSAEDIAIVGAKDKQGHPVDLVGRYLIQAGYTIWPVHPARRNVWGLPAFPSLAALPGTANIITLFRTASACPEHAREVLALPWKPAAFWMQTGIHSPEAGQMLAAHGISVFEDMCIMVEHRRLFAGASLMANKPSQEQGSFQAFDCRMCGECCQGKGGIVVASHDLSRLCAHLHMEAEKFIELYGYRQDGKIKIRTGPENCCIFFLPDTGCSVHKAKPDICRAWPFFRGNMVDGESLAMAKKFCPGINFAIGHDAFVRAGLRYLEEHQLRAFDPEHEANALIGVLQ